MPSAIGAPTSSASSRTARAITRLVGAVLAEQHDEWPVTHRYMSLEYLAKKNVDEEVSDETMRALAIAVRVRDQRTTRWFSYITQADAAAS